MNIIYTYLSQLDTQPLPHNDVGSNAKILIAIDTALGLLGAVAFIIIILAGIRYITSRGDPQTTVKAKNTILYAVVGLVISMSAVAIVSFVVGGL